MILLSDGYVKTVQEKYQSVIDAAKERIQSCIDDYKTQDPIKRTKLLHSKIDIKTMDLVTECKKGCAYCCHLPLGCTEDEAKVLAVRVESGVKANLRQMRKQRYYNYDPGEWAKIPLRERRCPFLGRGNVCMVYDDRPFNCRNYNTTSAIIHCEKGDGSKIKPIRDDNVEHYIGIMLNLSRFDKMSELVLKELG